MFAVYFLMHNQLCWPAKATYTVEMNSQDRTDGTFQGTGAVTIGGGEISKSTQNLISAMEEVPTLPETFSWSFYYSFSINVLSVCAAVVI